MRRATREQTRLPGTGAAALSPRGPPSLSWSESSSPARECAQGRGARGEVARPARAAIPPPLLLPPRWPSGGLPKGRGSDRRGCRGHPGRARGELNAAPGVAGGSGGVVRAAAALVAGAPSLRGPQGWEPTGRPSALARLGRSWQPRLLPGSASSRLSPPSEAPSSPAPHLPLATPAASLRRLLSRSRLGRSERGGDVRSRGGER